MKWRIGLVLALALAAAWMAEAAERSDLDRTISVAGTAVTTTAPDEIVWRINTRDTDTDLLRAKEGSDVKLKAILALVEELGVKSDDVQTGRLNIWRDYYHDAQGNRTEFKCFVVDRGVTLKETDLKKFDEFLTKLVSSAQMEVNFQLQSSKMQDILWETRLKALRIARDKAQAMTKELGVKLGKVLTIEEYKPAEQQPAAPISNVMYARQEAPSAADFTTGTFAPGSIEIRATVYAKFEIE